MFSILSAVAAFFNAIRALIGWQNREADRQAGAAEAILKGHQEADEAISTANKARADMHDANISDPASVLRDDDGFRRPD
jgi:hypothetical protein